MSDARLVGTTTARDWERVMHSLDEMSADYRAALGLEEPRATGTSGWRGGDEPGERYGRAPRPADPMRLAGELDRRAQRALALARNAGAEEVREKIGDFAEAAGKLWKNYGSLSPEDRRERVEHLQEEARDVDEAMEDHRAPIDVIDAWSGVKQVLADLRTIG